VSVRQGTDNYFENFAVGDRFRHFRGKTVTDFETHTLSQLVMNTSEGHFNEVAMEDSPFGSVVTFGVIVASIVWGIASQDTAEHAVEELGIRELRLRSATRSGDTLFAETEVLEATPLAQADMGDLVLRHVGINQDDVIVCDLVRALRVRRRPSTD
jgi:acyl dehydratase